MNETREYIEIDLRRILLALWSRLWVILLAGALLGGLAFGYAWMFIMPTYSASAQMYVNNNYENSPGFSSSQLTAAQDLADTYMVIMRSRNVLDDVAEETGLPYSYGQLRSMISASSVNDTEVFQVTVTGTNYVHCAQIANAVAKVLPDKIAAVVEGSSVRVVDRAVENPSPVGPDYGKYAMMGFIIGAGIAAVLVVVLNLMDTTINTEEFLSHVYHDTPLLAVIPGSESAKNGYYKGYKGYYKGSYESEQARQQRTAKKGGGAK